MANYIKESLESGEHIVLSGRLHWSYVFRYYLSFAILLIAGVACLAASFFYEDYSSCLLIAAAVFVVLGISVYAVGSLVRTRTEFAVTNTRFIQKDGILNIKMTEIPLFKIETVNFYQTLGQRILGTGCIELVGSGGTSHRVHCMEHPMEVRRTIVSAINNPKAQQAEQPVVTPTPAPQPAPQPAVEPTPAPEVTPAPAPESAPAADAPAAE